MSTGTGRSDLARFLRDFNLMACARCGKAACGDTVTVNAIYSVMIESPCLATFICACPEPR